MQKKKKKKKKNMQPVKFFKELNSGVTFKSLNLYHLNENYGGNVVMVVSVHILKVEQDKIRKYQFLCKRGEGA